jgi:uncharacterized integral membrane protein (TIGR00698 family)
MSRPDDNRFVHAIVPGLAVLVVVASGAWLLVNGLKYLPPPVGQWPVSMMLVAILAGLTLSGLAARRPTWTPGLALAQGPILKLAVALIGLRLSLAELGQLGVQALPLVIAAALLGLLLVFLLARLAGTGPRLTALLAVGTSICGASAIAAAAPGLRARGEEIGYAMACIAVVGLAATVLYPPLLQQLFDDPHDIGLILGAAVHDTAQVTAAAVLHEQVSGQDGTLVAATVTKLIRNAGMLILIPAVVWISSRHQDGGRPGFALPWFIVAFIALSALRSFGDAWLGTDHAVWQRTIELAGQFSLFAFAMAMSALAMAVRPAQLRAIGWKPAMAAIIAALGMLALAVIWVY